VLPAMIITRQPEGSTHFAVVWRRHGSLVQVMDPGVGRRWVRTSAFLQEVYRHTQTVEAADWFEYATSDAFLAPLLLRMRAIGGADQSLIERAVAGGVASLARLDAATRLVNTFVECGAVSRGSAAIRLLAKLATGSQPIPEQYWSVTLDPASPD